MKKGRLLNTQDNRENTPLVVVINEALAQQFFPGEEVLGKRISTGLDEKDEKSPRHWRKVVGVVGNVKRSGVTEPAHAEYYVPYAQTAVAAPYIAMRVAGNPASYAQAVSRAVAELDKEVPVYRVRSMDDGISAASAQPRFQALLLTAFAELLCRWQRLACIRYYPTRWQRTHTGLGLRMARSVQASLGW